MELCKITFGNKSIPVTYNEEAAASRIAEATYMLKKAGEYFTEHKQPQELIDVSIADEVIYSSYIEGYDVGFGPELLVKEGFSRGWRGKANKAVVCGYKAHKNLIANPSSETLDSTKLLNIWRELIKYKPLLRNYRKTGVVVRNRFQVLHAAPDAKYVKGLVEQLLNDTMPRYADDALLQSLLFHYVFAFIHPFIDGNGRTARLIEESILMKHFNLDLCIPISASILQDKKMYYKTFKSGQKFGESHLDILEADITDFINNNCMFISMGIASLMASSSYSHNIKLPEELNFHDRDYKKYTREEVIVICGGIGPYCELMCTGDMEDLGFGIRYDWGNRRVKIYG